MRWFAKAPRYEKVAGTESTDDVSQQIHTGSFTAPRRGGLVSHINYVFFVANVMFLAATLWTYQHLDSPNWLLKKTNSYTPLLDRFDFSFHRVKNNASLFNTPYSIYKDDPSPAVDAAWDEIADTPVLVISKEDVIKMGKDPDYVVRVPEEFGYGEDAYFAVNDGQHLIHCLDELRKFAHYDYYYAPKYGAPSNLPRMVTAHRSHCVGVLLDALTCQPSLNMVVWEYVEGQSEPWPDFDTVRQCQGHGEFYEWMKGLQVDVQKIAGWDWSVGRVKERPALGTTLEGEDGNAHAGGHDGHRS